MDVCVPDSNGSKNGGRARERFTEAGMIYAKLLERKGGCGGRDGGVKMEKDHPSNILYSSTRATHRDGERWRKRERERERE